MSSTYGHGGEHHISAKEVEIAARGVLEAHPDVKSVEGVIVHFQYTVPTRVDANIRVNPKRLQCRRQTTLQKI